MNDSMIVNILQDLVKGAVPPQTDAPKGPKLIIYNDVGGDDLTPHTFIGLFDENGNAIFSGFAPEADKKPVGDGKIFDEYNHEYTTKTEFDISKEQYEKAIAFIKKSEKNPPFYNLPNGYQCSVWAIELTNEIGLANINIDNDGNIRQTIIINPYTLALADYLGILKSRMDKSKQSGLFDKLVANLGDFVVNGHSLGGDTANISLYDPIALDLNANGKIDTLSLENGVFFDHNGDEIAFKSSWISGCDGILARDINGDKEINSGAELFGNFTRLKNGELAKNGAEAGEITLSDGVKISA